jgi:hypothetical protein
MNDYARLRRMVMVIRDVARTEHFENYADLKDAVRRQFNLLRIEYQPVEFDDAFVQAAQRHSTTEDEPLVDISRHMPKPKKKGPASGMELWARRYAEFREPNG